MVTFLKEHPLAKNSDGTLRSRIATAFPRRGLIVTVPGIHATQRAVCVEMINQENVAAGKPKLTAEQEVAEWDQAVDLIVDADTILIRPDPDNMPLAFEADEMLQELVPKRKVKFLNVMNDKVRLAVQRRGEAWRINPLPRSDEQMRQMIRESRIAIGGKPIYYYNAHTGTRWLTCQDFAGLNALDDAALRLHLLEIAGHLDLRNARGRREVDFFLADNAAGLRQMAEVDFTALDAAQLRQKLAEFGRLFIAAVPANLRLDDLENESWRNHMYCALSDQHEEMISEESALGLAPEYFMQVEWLPGAQLADGELIFDAVFDEPLPVSESTEQAPWEDMARGLIGNLVQEFGDLEYLNIGRVSGSLALQRGPFQGRREVFVVQIKQREVAHEILQIIRMQKWGVRERLDQGKDLLRAMIESEEYTEYILDRRLGCRQLGMNLSPRISTRKLTERYAGKQRQLEGITIWSPYFQRDYLPGFATTRLPPDRLRNPEYARGLARLLGRAAAPNLIVGRADAAGRIIFDDGDEVVAEDLKGMPVDIIVADHTGTFGSFREDLMQLAPHYATAVNRRVKFLPDAREFAGIYLQAFIARFQQIQAEYRRRKGGFDHLFKHRHRDPAGNFAYRWECILGRLNAANADSLGDCIKANFTCGS